MSDFVTRKRTICYVDGFNLYYGLRDGGLRNCYWLNIRDMAARIIRPPFVLAGTKYFTARVSGKRDGDSEKKAAEREASRKRQGIFLEALETIRTLETFEGHYLLKRDHCRACKQDFMRPEEKMTDVCIATEMVADAFLNRFDSAVIVSGDSDLVPPIRMVKTHFPDKSIVVAFPPNRGSAHLRRVADKAFYIWPRTLERCQMPDEIKKPNGTVLRRPSEWC
jgi:uncharacterized LabA/DUF88 family protein